MVKLFLGNTLEQAKTNHIGIRKIKMLKSLTDYFSCSKCHGKGFYRFKVKIPKNELSAIEYAENLISGGYSYRTEIELCKCKVK